jgi:hypothetical protein
VLGPELVVLGPELVVLGPELVVLGPELVVLGPELVVLRAALLRLGLEPGVLGTEYVPLASQALDLAGSTVAGRPQQVHLRPQTVVRRLEPRPLREDLLELGEEGVQSASGGSIFVVAAGLVATGFREGGVPGRIRHEEFLMTLLAHDPATQIRLPDLEPAPTTRAGHDNAVGRGRRRRRCLAGGGVILPLLGYEGLGAMLATDPLTDIDPPDL